jgi:glycosyltransferase involved in cell wall biosynthesis
MSLLARRHQVRVLRRTTDHSHPRMVQLQARSARASSIETGSNRLWLAGAAVTPRRWRVGPERQAMVRAAREMLRFRPDTVVVSLASSYDGVRFLNASRLMRVPYVLISQKASEEYWPRDVERVHYHELYAGAYASLFVSEHNRRVTEDQLGPLDNAHVVHNPIPHGYEGPLPWPTGDPPRMACVARLCASEKGQDALLRVLSRRRWQDRDFTLTLYGSGHDEQGLKDLAERLRVRQVRFAGATTDIAAVWREASMLVLPSRAEGLPLVLTEAMMYGRPALVTDVGGNAEVVEDGVTGFISPGPALDALDQTLDRAWRGRENWPAMGREAAVRIRRWFPGRPGAAGEALADVVEQATSARWRRPGARGR